jgi:hypothetical protein
MADLSPAQVAAQRAQGSVPLRNIAEMVTGGLNSPVAGRTDHLPLSTPSGSYVIPADVVSYLGEGNTQAGIKHLDTMFGKPAPQLPQAGTPPVNVMVAGGEYIVPPQVVMQIGHGDAKAGHDVLDMFVKHMRAENVKHLRSMPGPIRNGHR